MIWTDFTQIADLKIGKYEKLIYVIDAGQDVLAEYYANEIGCIQSQGVIECNAFFIDTEIKCEKGSNKFLDIKDKTCKCLAGFFLEKSSGKCQKCSCPDSLQVCTENATDCGEIPEFSIRIPEDVPVQEACMFRPLEFRFGVLIEQRTTYLATSYEGDRRIF